MSYNVSNKRINYLALKMSETVPQGSSLDEVIFAALWVASNTLQQSDKCRYSANICFSILEETVRDKLIEK